MQKQEAEIILQLLNVRPPFTEEELGIVIDLYHNLEERVKSDDSISFDLIFSPGGIASGLLRLMKESAYAVEDLRKGKPKPLPPTPSPPKTRSERR